MYVVFMKKFLLPIRTMWWVLDSFRLPELKNVSFLLSRHHVRPVHEKFSFADSTDLMGIRLISAFLAQNVWSYFLDMMYVKFMKNFLLNDSGELFALWLISASWAQKRLIPTL